MTTTPAPERLAYSPAEAASALGVSRQHLYNLMRAGLIRSHRIGNSRRIPAAEVTRLANEGTAAGAPGQAG